MHFNILLKPFNLDLLLLPESMKAFIKNIASVFLAFLVLFSTMSFSIHEHYCGDTLVDTAIFKQAKTRGIEMSLSKTTSEDVILQKNCCKNEHIVIEGQDELKTTVNSLSLDQQLFVASFVYYYINLFEGLDEKVIPFKNFPLPLVDKDIQVLYQTFLI